MKIQNKKGFTLIELLVVITIIGILATGATATYTSQIQKARDSTRITSLNALASGVEQEYQDSSQYPHAENFYKTVGTYVETLPSDPKHGETCNKNGSSDNVICAYAYKASPDANSISFGAYELSTAFENTGNVENRATGDAGDDDLRLEMGMRLSTIDTSFTTITTKVGVCDTTGANITAADSTTLMIINGNPASATLQCG